MVSVIIPSRVGEYLQRTVDDLIEKAHEDVEVIVVLDGYWPEPRLKKNDYLTIVHQGTVHDNLGMRAAINTGMLLAKGEYVMKIDEHCMMDDGWDVKLKADCEDDWMVVPRRYRLDAEAWDLTTKTQGDTRPPIDYMYIAYPYSVPFDRRSGLYGGGVDKERYVQRKYIEVDETMSMQGSCYFLKREYWFQLLHPMDEERYGSFNHEAQELHFKVQLSGGKLMVNKKTWYAHLHKGTKGKGYGFSRAQYKKHEWQKEFARRNCMNYWLLNKWPKPPRKYDFEYLIDKFNPPGWPEDWRTRIHKDAKRDWSKDPSRQPSMWIENSGLPELEI